MADGRIIIDTLLDSHGIENGLGKLGGLTGAALKGVGLAVTGVGVAFAGVGAYAVKVGSDFEAAMSKVGAISGASAGDMVKLSDKAKQMGIDTKFSATESATALQYMAMAGWKTNDMLSGLPGIMNLAAASGEELGAVSDIVTDALTAFGMKASESGHFADVLAKASANSNTNVAMLGESFKYVAPLAGSLGYSVEDTSVALGLMANSGVKASMAGTSLKTALVNMAKPTKKMQVVMDKYNLSLSNADGTMKPLSGVTEELRTKMGGLDKSTQAAAAATLFGKESLAGMLAVINASPADYAKLTKEINNADGAADKMAKTMGNNLQGKLKLISSSLEGLGIQIYEKMKKPLTEAAETAIVSLSKLSKSLTSGDLAGSVDKIAVGFANLMKGIAEGVVIWIPRIITAFAWIMDNSSTIAAGIAGIGAAMIAMNIGNAVVAFIGIVKAFRAMQVIMPGLTAAQWLFDAAVAACGGPIVLVISIIVGLIAALVVLWNTNEGFRNAVIGVWESIKNAIVGAVTAVIGFVQNNWKQLLLFLVNPIAGALALLYNLCPQFKEWVDGLYLSISTGFTNILNSIVAWGTSVIAWVTTNVPLIVNNIITFFAELPGKVATVFTNVINAIIAWGASVIAWVVTTIPMIINNIFTFFNELPGKIGFALGFALVTIIKWGIDTFNYLVTNVPKWINAVYTYFSQLPGKIWICLINAYNKIVTWGSQTYNNMVTSVSKTINAVANWFGQLPGRVWTWLSNTISKVAQWGSQTYSNMTSAASRAVNAVGTFFGQLPGKVWSCLANALSKMAQFASNLASKARQAGSGMVSNIMGAVASLPSRMASIGSNIVQGVWNGIQGMGGWLASKVGDFFGGIVNGAKAALGIHSPSRVMRDQVGKFIPLGVGAGIDDEMPNLQKDIESNMGNLAAKMKATVDFETAKTSTGVVASSNYKVAKDNSIATSSDAKEGDVYIVKNYMDSDEISEYTYKKVNGKFAMAGKRVR